MNPNAKFIIWGSIGLIAFLFILVNFPIVVVGAGQRGVVFNSFSGVENQIMGEGTHLRTPFVQNIIEMSIQTQATPFDENAGTQDSQTIDVKYTVNWHLDPSKVNSIYQKIGNNDAVIANVLTPNAKDALKSSISKYQALEIQQNRDVVAQKAQDLLTSKLKRYDVLVDNLSITNINFSAQFNDAVEEAQVQQQKAKAAQYAVVTAKNNADATIATANGQAQAQQLLQQALTPALLQKMSIDKWDGKLPTLMGANTPLPFLTVNP